MFESHLIRCRPYGTLQVMISPQLAIALQSTSDLSDGYVYHPVVIRMAIDDALAGRFKMNEPECAPDFTLKVENQSDICSVQGCDREAHARSMCRPHYKRFLRGSFSARPVRLPNSKIGRAKRKSLIKAAIVSLMGNNCMLCNDSYPNEVYEFHHVFEKDRDNFSVIFTKLSSEKIALEISKCVLLCANCHRMEHIWLRQRYTPLCTT